ncbi:hypothetical protein [Thiohalorhabdus denitrificans]|uniref:Outer membrane protein beta-barrel domain-containing protein n=1 Tax=Thiohalorhabdus denitrificans TaxID=381306 RepID=A0A1G5B0C9_9GAMM|nr:hypothetical protein [Thiohalorhabdus denitrificans]SCX83608.1 Outer membrane protein beta-barrel domain-containing protein [Thiohalorhabdus denitrificans]
MVDPKAGGRFGVLLAALAGTAPAAAEDVVTVEAMAADFRYEEPKMEEHGPLFGVRAEWWDRYDTGKAIRVSGGVLAGGTDYDGVTWGGDPVETDTDDAVLWGGIRHGWPSGALEPYLGLGVRYWRQTLNGPGGYDRSHTYFYLPVGLSLGSPQRGPGWGWRARAEYRHLLGGMVVSELSDADPRVEDARNDLNNGLGLHGEVTVSYRDADGPAWNLSLYAEYWDLDRSDYDTIGLPDPVSEPANETTVVGLRAGAAF